MLQPLPVKLSHFVPSVIQAGGERTGYGPPQSEIGLSFFNGLPSPVSIVTRTGVRYYIRPNKTQRTSTLVIRYGVVSSASVIVDAHGLLNDEGKSTSKEAQALDAMLMRPDVGPGRYGLDRGTIDYHVKLLELQQYGGSVYLPNLDLVVSVEDPDHVPPHPFAMGAQLQGLGDVDPITRASNGLTFQIKIVDNNGRYGARYINISGEVYQVPTEPDSNYREGVYLMSSFPVAGQRSALPGARVQYYSFEEAEQALRLYRTYADALTLGNPTDAYKRELEERGHKLKLDQQQWAEDKLRRDVEWETKKREWETEREEAKNRLSAQEERLKERQADLDAAEHLYRVKEQELRRDTLVLKEYSDLRSHERRELLETLKHIPALISGCWAIYTAIKKLKTP